MTSKQMDKLTHYIDEFDRIASSPNFSKEVRNRAKAARKRAVALAKVCAKLDE
jgi:predicted house-cleaning noncanonical NTP pyrophosphatase (MazG superfamily)